MGWTAQGGELEDQGAYIFILILLPMCAIYIYLHGIVLHVLYSNVCMWGEFHGIVPHVSYSNVCMWGEFHGIVLHVSYSNVVDVGRRPTGGYRFVVHVYSFGRVFQLRGVFIQASPP